MMPFGFFVEFFLLSGKKGYAARQNIASGAGGRSSMNAPPLMELAVSLLCSEELTTGTVPAMCTKVLGYA